jgi:hypothetical protein
VGNYSSRYELGDTVWGLAMHPHRFWKVCDVCHGTKKVSLVDSELTAYCPAKGCDNGGKVSVSMGTVFEVRELTIGQVRIQRGYDPSTTYMCKETGVGSGRVWNEDLLFPTEQDATNYARSQGACTRAEMQVA